MIYGLADKTQPLDSQKIEECEYKREIMEQKIMGGAQVETAAGPGVNLSLALGSKPAVKQLGQERQNGDIF